MRNAIKAPKIAYFPQWWRKWKSDPECVRDQITTKS